MISNTGYRTILQTISRIPDTISLYPLPNLLLTLFNTYKSIRYSVRTQGTGLPPDLAPGTDLDQGRPVPDLGCCSSYLIFARGAADLDLALHSWPGVMLRTSQNIY